MKKTAITLSVIIATLWCSNIQAQYLSLGVKGGVSVNTFSAFPASNAMMGYNGGIFGWYSTQSRLGFGGDLTYSRVGGQYQRLYEGIPLSSEYETSLSYVNFTPKMGLFLNDYDSRIRPKVSFGPSIGYLVGAEEELRDLDLDNQFDTWNYGLVFGIGFNYELATAVWLNADLDYNLGLNNVSSHDMVSPSRLTNQGVGINLGIAFGIGDTTPE